MRKTFVFFVLLQVVLLIGIIAYRQYWVATGERILLKTTPVDPRDIFRGDYVSLRYEISSLNLDELAVKQSFKGNEKVYVILQKNPDGTFAAKSVSKEPPTGKKFIQGRALYEILSSKWEIVLKDDSENLHRLKPQWFSSFKQGDRVLFCLDERGNILAVHQESAGYKPECRGGQPLSGIVEEIKEKKFRSLNVEYGIENYFVEEGKGMAIESSRNARELRVEVSLRSDGKGIITGLFVNGKLVK